MCKYKFEKIKAPKETYYELYINADSNDGDYVSTTETFNQKEFDEIIDEIINLKNNYSEHGKLQSYPNEFDLSIPFNGYDDYCHTIVDIEVKMYDVDGTIYNVIF